MDILSLAAEQRAHWELLLTQFIPKSRIHILEGIYLNESEFRT